MAKVDWQKAARKMLMKLTSGPNFINVLCTAFTHADPRNLIKTVNLSIFFMLLGSMSVKAAHKTLVKLTPGLEPKNASIPLKDVTQCCNDQASTVSNQMGSVNSTMLEVKSHFGIFWPERPLKTRFMVQMSKVFIDWFS